ncbi:MAG: dockerin type I domain-containing protein [Ignavibacteria bacterium]|nr:dockerin type I domain-containing protein [Ignavibacteria bacterium]
MKRVLYIVILFISTNLFGQEILIVRTDVDSTRKSFVTATYNFSFKIVLKDVLNCTSVSFVLRHNQPEFIKFSNFKPYEFSKNGSVFVYPWLNPIDGYVRIYSGILNGDTIGGKGINNPEVIEFEFTVSPDAPSNSIVEFYFEDAEAVVTENNIGKIIKLKSKPTLYNVHGYVNVWPGDANNDGVVNINDVSTVALFLGYGPNKPNFRSFQRIHSSTNWFPQSCLAWDSLASTFADCNGDGEVTINDMLIIPLNFGKTHQARTITSNYENIDEEKLVKIDNFIETTYSIVSDEPIIGFVAEVEKINQSVNSITFNKCDNFRRNIFIKSFETQDKSLIILGSTNNDQLNEIHIGISNYNRTIFGRGITREGRIINANLVPNSIVLNNENSENNTISFFVSLEYPIVITIYNILGELVTTRNVYSFDELYEIIRSKGIFSIKKINTSKNNTPTILILTN